MPDPKIPIDAPPPRLCHIIKWSDFDGYGFNLHCGKDRPGQYIGKVDENSPAETGGLRQNDRIVEVNGVNISNENHKQVVQRIKAVPNETRLLVVSPDADKYYKSLGIVVTGDQENVDYIKTPTCNPKVAGSDSTDAVSEKSSTSKSSKQAAEPSEHANNKSETESHSDRSSSVSSTPQNDRKSLEEVVTTNKEEYVEEKIKDLKIQTETKAVKDVNSAGLNLNMSAKEMREMVAQTKKRDPRKDHLDFKKKYEIIKTM